MSNHNEIDYLWVVVPLLGSWLLTLFIGKIDYKNYIKIWFQPSEWVYFAVWTIVYLILGLILYRSYAEEDKLLFYLVIGLTLVTYLWLYTFTVAKSPRHSLFLLVFLIVLSLFIYTELFYSNTVSNDTPDSFGKGYLFLFVLVIVWFLFSLVLSSHTKHVTVFS